jgi:hypothetical protein
MIMMYGVIIFILYKTGKSFSTPIRNTIKLFKRLSEGIFQLAAVITSLMNLGHDKEHEALSRQD